MRRWLVLSALGLSCATPAPATDVTAPRVVDIAPPPPVASAADDLRPGIGLTTTGTVFGDGETVEIRGPVSVAHALQLRVGARASFRPPQFPNASFEGRVDVVERTTIRISMANMDRRLKSGMTGPLFVDLSRPPP
jgi:hypothetical protein